MARQSINIRYSSWDFIKDRIVFIFNYLFSFHDPGQDHIVETNIDHIQPDELQKIRPYLIVLVHTPTSVKILDR